MSLGVNADSIIFANPTKITSHLRYAAELDVRKMTADGEFELRKIHELFPSAEYVWLQWESSIATFSRSPGNITNIYRILCLVRIYRLVLRIKYDAKGTSHSYGEKFGCDPELEAPQLILLAKALGLNVIL